MENKAILDRFTVSGLRTRFLPRNRIGQGLITITPWVNVALLVGYLIYLEGKLVLQPGQIVELPRTSFQEGLHPCMTLVVLSYPGPTEGERREAAFFEDVRYDLWKDRDIQNLRDVWQRYLNKHADAQLTLLADNRVHYGTVVHLCNMARELGVRKVNLASREDVSGHTKK